MVVVLGGAALVVFKEDIDEFFAQRQAEQEAADAASRKLQYIISVNKQAQPIIAKLMFDLRDPFTRVPRVFAAASSSFAKLKREHDEPIFEAYRELCSVVLSEGRVAYIREKESGETMDAWARRPCSTDMVDYSHLRRAFDVLAKGLEANLGADLEEAFADAKAVALSGQDPAKRRALTATFVKMLRRDAWLSWAQSNEGLASTQAVRSREQDLFDFTRRAAYSRAGEALTAGLFEELVAAVTAAARALDKNQPLPPLRKGG